ncbi:hypothetical protein HU200_042981 [Digitaria exilis]|uniref:BTB domain-containing protein n=1 Tax=Digitaria exilis TaxID=1010633 RepID=A0A835B421_9POAL|nr:hypothetical protein HU200_042981 [Digitaria exilis]
MEHGRTNLTESVRSVHLLKINGFCATASMDRSECIKSRWNVAGHEWEVHLYPNYFYCNNYPSSDIHGLALKLFLRVRKTWATLSCRLVDPSRNRDPSEEKWSICDEFERRRECLKVVRLMERDRVLSSGYLVNDSLTVQCTLTVLKELPDMLVIPSVTEVPLPSSDLHRHFGELLQGQRGSDVTFVLDSGERFPAHKTILAARSPVFMAQFFGEMNERSSHSVRVQDMQAAVFRAMIHFIYTDTAPELDEEPQTAPAMAQHLLAAADRYGLERLKLICEGKLSGGVDVYTAATTLALAEQHNCSLLKAKCVDFITRSPETLNAVLATDGYRHLVESCPLVLTELLKETIACAGELGHRTASLTVAPVLAAAAEERGGVEVQSDQHKPTFTYLLSVYLVAPPPSLPRAPVALTMEHGRTNLTEAVRSVQLLKIDGYCGTSVMPMSDCIKSRWNVDGHEWEGGASATAIAILRSAPASRYGLDRLKLMCELKLSDGIDVDTAATTLALAEQHSCSVLKTKCVDFITRSPETLNAVLATDGYKHLVESCPLVLTELLRVAHGRRN